MESEHKPLSVRTRRLSKMLRGNVREPFELNRIVRTKKVRGRIESVYMLGSLRIVRLLKRLSGRKKPSELNRLNPSVLLKRRLYGMPRECYGGNGVVDPSSLVNLVLEQQSLHVVRLSESVLGCLMVNAVFDSLAKTTP